ncbi:MAG: ATP-dependent helicase [Proteobacteria bacterium]|nr:ATP-dependent helicase [Pseudomonadota bacterium]
MEAKLLGKLNAAQRAAATHGSPRESPPLLVIAGAGTGKTNTLAHRVAHLVLQGVRPERILLLTFSRRAAQELARRSQAIVARALPSGGDAAARLPWAGTFHSVANRLLRQYAAQVGLEPGFGVMDRGDSADLLDVARHELGLSTQDRRFPRKDTCLAIYSHCVNTQLPLETTLADAFPWCAEWQPELKSLFRRYVDAKLAQQVLDYDDLLLYWHMLMQDAALARDVEARFDHVLVDEYQDTNTLQADILLALKPSGAGLCVVGDDAQSIYSFRAANVANILEFPARFSPPARVVALEENYRSTQPILDAANALMADADKRFAKNLRSQRPAGARARVVTVLDELAQAHYVVEGVLAAREQGTPLRRQAVLFRSAHHSDVLELELVRRDIPYVKYGGLKFLEASHVKDLLSVLRWADNRRNRVAAHRVLQLLPGMGPVNADRCFKALESAQYDWGALAGWRAPAAALEHWPALFDLLAGLGSPARGWEGQVGLARQWYEPHLARLYEESAARAGDLEQLERIALQFSSREQFLSELTLDPPQATSDYGTDARLDDDFLILSTVHSAKGQEWDNVHVLNVTDGNFPNEYANGKPERIEEERRLLYVAMTRARNELDLMVPLKFYVTHQARSGDAHVYGARSRFLNQGVMATMEATVWPAAGEEVEPKAKSLPRVDVAARLRGAWT